MESATRRQVRERHRLALIVAFAVNDPKGLDKVAPPPGNALSATTASDAASSTVAKGQFEEQPWW